MEIHGHFQYNGIHTTQQVPNIKSYFESLLKEENFDVIIEIGTSFGGLTQIIDDIIKENNLKHNIHTFDFSHKDYVENQLKERNCFYYIMDEREDDFKNAVKNLIGTTEKVLLLCDGGNKIDEFNTYSKLLKVGDVIMAHDYAYNEQVFLDEMKDKYWNWFEINYDDIKSTVESCGLTEYNKTNFKYAAWACYQKN
mgnify:FL=1